MTDFECRTQNNFCQQYMLRDLKRQLRTELCPLKNRVCQHWQLGSFQLPPVSFILSPSFCSCLLSGTRCPRLILYILPLALKLAITNACKSGESHSVAVLKPNTRNSIFPSILQGLRQRRSQRNQINTVISASRVLPHPVTNMFKTILSVIIESHFGNSGINCFQGHFLVPPSPAHRLLIPQAQFSQFLVSLVAILTTAKREP